MKKKILLIDMDHVIADLTSQYIQYYKKATGIEIKRNKLLTNPEDETFRNPGLIKMFLQTPGIFRNAAVMPGSQLVVRELNEMFELYIVSAAMEFPQSLLEKYEWLHEHFPFIKWSQIIFCGSKKNIAGDYMIDDHLKNLENFNGIKLLFTASHNAHINSEGCQRVNDWKEVKQFLIDEQALCLQ